jgi:hypothetical protein
VESGDVVTLTLPMTIEKKVLEGQGICFQRGPLLYAYAIPQQMTEDTEQYANMHGKMPENPDFKCWNITPTGAFNYAYADDGQAISVNYPPIEEIGGTIPFDLNYTPTHLRIPVKQIDWSLVDGRYTPALPEQGKLTLLSDETQYIDLVPYGCTELRLTVFPAADAQPLPTPEEPDYLRPADAPDCVQVVNGHYCAYFELPRFCWDEPIYCKVRTADGTADLRSPYDGDPCELVGTAANGRDIWRWTVPAVSEAAPVELIFTNNDLLTDILPFANGGYYNYGRLLYKAGEGIQTGISEAAPLNDKGQMINDDWYTLDGRKIDDVGTGPVPARLRKGLYIHGGRKVLVRDKR